LVTETVIKLNSVTVDVGQTLTIDAVKGQISWKCLNRNLNFSVYTLEGMVKV